MIIARKMIHRNSIFFFCIQVPNRFQPSAFAMTLAWIHLTIGFSYWALNESIEKLINIKTTKSSKLEFFKNVKGKFYNF